jgi:hypothetical protein
MNYKVPLKKLVKILNPFEQHLVNYQVIDKPTVKSYLKNHDIFGDLPWSKEKHVAALIANYYPEEIVLNILEQVSDPKEMLISGGYDLAAAIYRNEEYIVARISGDEKIIKKLLSVSLSKPDNVELPEKPEVIPFKWDINFNLKKESWGDIDFVISKLKENCEENIRFIDESLWHNPQFLKKLIREDKNIKGFIWSKELKTDDCLFDIIKSNHHEFKDWWNSTYQRWFDNEKSDGHYGTEKITPKQKNIIQRIRNEIFSDPAYMLKLFEAEYSWQSHRANYEKYIPVEVFFNEKIIDLVIKKKEEETAGKNNYSKIFSYINHLECVPADLAHDNEWMRKFLTKYLKFQSGYHSDTIPKNLYANWINDKDEVLKNLDSIKTSVFSRIYKHLPDNLKEDKEISEKFLDNFPFLLPKTPEKYRQDKKRILAYLNTCDHSLASEILDIIYQKKDKDLMKDVLRIDANLLFKKECPEELMFDIELVKIVAQNDRLSFLNKKQENILFGKKEYAIEIVKYSDYTYDKLLPELKLDHDIALQNIEYHGTCEIQLLANKQFSIEALKANQNITKHIPKQYWYEKDFVLAVCQAIDDEICSSEIFTMAPVEVKTFFDSYKVESNFTAFISKYLVQQKLTNELLPDSDENEEEIPITKMKI